MSDERVVQPSVAHGLAKRWAWQINGSGRLSPASRSSGAHAVPLPEADGGTDLLRHARLEPRGITEAEALLAERLVGQWQPDRAVAARELGERRGGVLDLQLEADASA